MDLQFLLGWGDRNVLEKVAEQDIGVVSIKVLKLIIKKKNLPSHFQKSFDVLGS